MVEKNYYEILGVSPTSSPEEIKRAYRHKAIKFHPDKNPDDMQALDKFRQITEAYNTLIDYKLRAKYDRQLINNQEKFKNSIYKQKHRDSKLSEVKKILSSIFTKDNNIDDRKSQSNKGIDIRQEVSITLSEAALGCEKIIEVNYDDVSDKYGYNLVINRTKKVRISIYPGIRDGTCLKFKSQGISEVPNGPKGDLYFHIRIKPDDFFTLKDDDIHCEIELDFVDALLKKKIKVPTIYGIVGIDVPNTVQPGQTFRIKEQGFPKSGGQGRGDQFVKVKIVFPQKVSPKQRELLEQFYNV